MKKLALDNLQPGQQYAVQVRSVSEEGKSQWSNTLYFTAKLDDTPPSEVTGLEVTSESSSWLAKWNPIDTTGFVPQNNDFAYYEVRVTNDSQNVSYKVPTARFDFTVEMNRAAFGVAKSPIAIAVRSVDQSGNTSDWVSHPAVSNPPPGPPTNLDASQGVDAIYLNWNAPSDEDIAGYKVYVSSTVDGTFNLIGSPTGTSYTYSTTSISTVYFKVSTVDLFGNESETVSISQTSKTIELDTDPPEEVTAVVAESDFDSIKQQPYITVTWENPDDEDLDRVNIRWSTNGTSWNYIAVPSSPSTSGIHRFEIPVGPSIYIAVQAQDFYGNKSSWVNAATYPATVAADTTPPSAPQAPSISGGILSAFVTVSGDKAGGGSMEPDVVRYEVYASTADNFTTYDSSTLLGTIDVGLVMTRFFSIPATKTNKTWYFKVIAVDRSGNRSAASPQTSATVSVIDSVTIENNTITAGSAILQDAAITNAKIADLAVDTAKIREVTANKFRAGSAIVTDLIIDDGVDPVTGLASTGSIRSENFSDANRTGMKLDKTGLTVYDGLIKAKAVELSSSYNSVAVPLASFEGYISSLKDHICSLMSPIPVEVGYSIDSSRFALGTQSLRVNTGVLGGGVTLGSLSNSFATLDADIQREYIVSFYARSDSNITLTAGIYDTYNSTPVGNPVDFSVTPTWNRYSFIFTNDNAEHIQLDLQSSIPNMFINLDGFQVEERIGALDTPSPWRPPSSTSINGGMIRFGQMSGEHLEINSVDGDRLRANAISTRELSSLIVISGRFTTSETGSRAEINESGMQAFRTTDQGDELFFQIPTDPQQDAFLKGKFNATELLIDDRLALGGQENAMLPGSILTLQQAVESPKQSLIVENFYMSEMPYVSPSQLPGWSYWGDVAADNTHMYVLWAANPSNTAMNISRFAVTVDSTGKITGLTLDPNWSITLPNNTSWLTITIQDSRVLAGGVRSTGSTTLAYDVILINKTNASIIDTRTLTNTPTSQSTYTGMKLMSTGANTFAALLEGRLGRRYTINTTNNTISYHSGFNFFRTFNAPIGFYGVGDMADRDGYGSRYWLADMATRPVWSLSTDGTNRATEDWYLNGNLLNISLFQFNGRMVSAGTRGGGAPHLYVHTYSSDTWAIAGPTASRAFAYTFFDDNPLGGGTYETGIGTSTVATVYKRAYTRMTGQKIPASNETANTPTRIRAYVNTAPVPSGDPGILDFKLIAPDNFPPEVSFYEFPNEIRYNPNISPGQNEKFPSAIPSTIKSDIGGFEVKGDGTGDWPLILDPIRMAANNTPHIRAELTAPQTIGNGAGTHTSISNIDMSFWSFHNGVLGYQKGTGIFTVMIFRSGLYFISFYASLNANINGNRFAGLRKWSGSDNRDYLVSDLRSGTAGNSTGVGNSDYVRLNAGDQIELAAWQTSGGNLAVNSANFTVTYAGEIQS